MIFLNLIWNGLNRNVIVVEVTESKLPVVDISKCLSISESSKHSTTLIAIYETFIHVLFKAENNKNPGLGFKKRVPEHHHGKQQFSTSQETSNQHIEETNT